MQLFSPINILMKKPIVQLEKTAPNPFKKVEWRLSNVCNYDCPYCPDESKRGDENYLDIEINKQAVDKLCTLFNNERIQFTFTGGEPTLYPKLHELFSYIKSKNVNHQIRMFTNGSRSVRWWQEFASEPMIDFIMFTYHQSQVKNIDSFVDAVNSIHLTNVQGLVFFTCTDIDFNETIESLNYISDRVGIDCHLKKIHSSSLKKYTDEQNMVFLSNRVVKGRLADSKTGSFNQEYNVYIKTRYYDGFVEDIHDPQELLVRGQNRFLFWDCDIGKDRIVIYSDRVYKSICQVGTTMYTIYDDFVPVTESTKCPFSVCVCGTDIMESKRSPIFKKNIPIQYQQQTQPHRQSIQDTLVN
jgi:organic radical activating enzyme